MRYCFIITDAPLTCDEPFTEALCHGCEACVAACPGKAIAPDGHLDPWQCAVYYNGANGTKNPFMSPDAFQGIEDRLSKGFSGLRAKGRVGKMSQFLTWARCEASDGTWVPPSS